MITGLRVCIWNRNDDFRSETIPYVADSDVRRVRIGNDCGTDPQSLIPRGGDIGAETVVAAGSIDRGQTPRFRLVQLACSGYEPRRVTKHPVHYHRDRR